MFRTILFYPGIILSLIIACIFELKVKILRKKRAYKEAEIYAHKVSMKWAKFIMKLAGAKITLKGEENLAITKEQTVLFIANHQSNFDIPLLLSLIDVPKGFIAKKELETWPFISTWMKDIRCVFMDRDNMRKSAEAIVEGINILKSGHSMVIFPEGTRSKGGPTHEFKAGSFKLATKSKVPIIPVTINGSYNLLEANGGGKIKSSNVEVIIHAPIETSKLSKEELASLHETVENIIVKDIKKA